MRLGDWLVEQGLIDRQTLEAALEEQRRSRERLGQILIRRGAIAPEALYEALERQLGIPRVRLSRMVLSPELAHLLPEEVARRYRAIPYERSGRTLRVAMVDPLDYVAIDDLELVTGLAIEPALVDEAEFSTGLARLYGPEEAVDVEGEGSEEAPEEAVFDETSPIVRFVAQTIERAVRLGASDVHFDPFVGGARVRFRIDGRLRTEQTIPHRTMRMAAARIKILAELDIAERRRPQDGRFRTAVDGREVDVRVSILPTIHGEKVVLRLLDQSRGVRRVEDLGLRPDNEARLLRLIDRPYGMLLVTGPTGSGKSTTLYALLERLNRPDRNIITVEDPVEYAIDGVNQIQVNPQAGLGFAVVLRSVLRQDPDVIMVGEIRDLETAEIAVRAALTGHLVLSTLHTNDAPGAIDRLRDMGIPPYLIAAALTGVVAQRLVRKVCPECRRTRPPTEAERAIFERHGLAVSEVAYGAGCPSCGYTGYAGRTAVQEVLVLDGPLGRQIAEGADGSAILQAAREQGFVRLIDDALEKASRGVTTVDEVLAVVPLEATDGKAP
ncbi:MAG: GspE/PulE family protein [Hydrogenibacillus schlegelii]|uniref:GspE/PulE family protein n=1 Tax=Hydrogenibacillus schlegelii TaxID=1484 RepID=A0A947G748_HYDSH|nr:GspE/PulE family protein [Hydrogenibacillus schlegelii]